MYAIRKFYGRKIGKGADMEKLKERWRGVLFCLIIAVPSAYLGNMFPIIGGPVIAIIAGMILTQILKDKTKMNAGITFTSKKILQYAVILLGFGLNLSVIFQTGKQSLPIIVSTIAASLIISYILYHLMKIPSRISVLIGVGSSICGGSAIAAAAPVIGADDEEVAQSISVIFFFNVLAAIIFPSLGAHVLGFSPDPEAFGIFAGTAVNDTSSVTAAASTWDSMFALGSQTLDKAVTVKLTRTLAIIPITLALAFWRAKKEKSSEGAKVSMKSIFPFFILYFVGASVITTVFQSMISAEIITGAASTVILGFFSLMKQVSKFFIVMAMAAIGLNTDIVKLVRSGGKPIFMGLCCWIGISLTSLGMQHVMGIW